MKTQSKGTERLLTEQDVCQLVAYGRVTLWKMCRDGRFPQPLRTGLRSKRWRSTDIDTWINNLQEEMA